MRFYLRDGEIEVVLSRRNLMAGLHKLQMKDSAREIQSNDGKDAADGMLLRLKFEDDEEHYFHPERHSPGFIGMMHPDTEEFIASPSEDLDYET